MTSTTVVCPFCDRLTSANRKHCEHCRELLSASPETVPTIVPVNRSRPGCITVYALLMTVGSLGLLLVFVMTPRARFLPEHIAVLAIAASGLVLLMAWGLWQMKPWGRRLALAVTALFMASNALQVLLPVQSRTLVPTSQSMEANVIAFAVQAYIFHWFYTHASTFEGSIPQ